MRAVLRLRAYRRLLAAYSLNEIAWAIGPLALSYLVYRRTGSAVGASAFYLCSMFVPALTAPVLVSRIDRRPARWLLPMLYTGESLVFAVLALVAGHFQLVPVLILALLDGILAMAARPIARAAAVAVTSEAGLLREGNALTNAGFSIAYMLGPGLGGAIVALGGVRVALFANTGVFLLISLALITCSELPAPTVGDTGRRRRLRTALGEVRRRPAIRTLLAVQAIGIVFYSISIPVEVVYARHSLHAGAGGYGALLSAWGGGAVVGSAIYARWRGAPARALLALGAGLIGVGMLGMTAAPVLVAAIAAAAVAGAGNGIEGVAGRTALQEQADPRWMAMMMSFSDSLNQAAPGLGIVLGGAVAALAGPRAALALGGVAALAVAGAAWLLLQPRRGFTQPATDSSPL